jgi:hypothetical protein
MLLPLLPAMTFRGFVREMMTRLAPAAVAVLWLSIPLGIYAQQGGTTKAAPPTPKAAAVVDFTGYWISVVTNSEQWLVRMASPVKGEMRGIPLTPEARKLANAWDPAKDDGDPCRAYGAPAIMNVPGRLHITWEDDSTLRIDTDSGKQTRLLHFGSQPATPGAPSIQGYSTAKWDIEGGRGTEGGAGAGLRATASSLKVMTANLRPGYLFKNGIPYSGNARMTEYFNRVEEPDGQSFLLVEEMLEDPQFLSDVYVRSWYFKKLPDGKGWNPTECSPR